MGYIDKEIPEGVKEASNLVAASDDDMVWLSIKHVCS